VILRRRIGVAMLVFAAGTCIALASPPALGQSPAPVLPGEPWILYQGGDIAVGTGGPTRLRLVRPDGRDDHRLPVAGDAGHPAWSPDGARVAFDVATPQEGAPARYAIWLAQADGSNPESVAACELPCLQLAYPAWSPSATRIAMVRYDIRADGDWGPSAVESLDMETGDRSVLAATPDGTTAFYTPRWSPDGSSIVAVVESYTDESQDVVTASSLVVLDASGTQTAAPVAITPDVLPAAQPDWGPQEDIVFVTAGSPTGWADDASLMLVQADGSALRPLVDPGPGRGIAGEPTWVSEVRIMFVAADATGERIAHVSADGSGLEREAWMLHTPRGSIQRTFASLRPSP
jgi:dipeptidyl aminopeptidase/acylaminoacyl peptidase